MKSDIEDINLNLQRVLGENEKLKEMVQQNEPVRKENRELKNQISVSIAQASEATSDVCNVLTWHKEYNDIVILT